MKKFEVTNKYAPTGNYYIGRGISDYMHRDGEIVRDAVEYWPTEEQAQAVLDKFQPKHVWVHGDVFRNLNYDWIYLKPAGVPRVMCITCPEGDSDIGSTPGLQLMNATFLFNIVDKL